VVVGGSPWKSLGPLGRDHTSWRHEPQEAASNRPPPNALGHRKWPCVGRTQLALGPVLQRVGRPVEEAELDPIANRKLQLAVVLVVVVLGVLPGLEKALADVGEEGVAITE